MLTWGSPLRSPAAAGRPSQEVAQPTWPPLLCRLPPRQGNGVCPTLAGTRARHLPPLLATSCFLLSPSMPRTKPRSCPAPLSLSLALLLSPCSLPLTREPPPPPTGIAVATGLPSPSRHTRKLRSSALKLPVKPCPSGHPVEPSPSPNSTPAAVDPRRRFGSYRASPTSRSEEHTSELQSQN